MPRPVQRLIPFEIREKSAVNPEDEVDMQESTVSEEEIPQETEIQDVVSNARPSRKAAVEGQAMPRVRSQYTYKLELLNFIKLYKNQEKVLLFKTPFKR